MRYADDTFALYGDLFKEAHDALVKEGRVGRFRQFLGRVVDPSAAKRVEGLTGQLEHAEVGLGRAAHEAELHAAEQAMNLRKSEQLAKEVEALGARPGALTEAQAGQEAAEIGAQQARRGRNLALGVGAAGLGVGLPAAYMAGHGQGEQGKTRTRNLAFGAGAAAGLAAPTLIKGLGHIARGAGQSGAFPELSGAGYGY